MKLCKISIAISILYQILRNDNDVIYILYVDYIAH